LPALVVQLRREGIEIGERQFHALALEGVAQAGLGVRVDAGDLLVERLDQAACDVRAVHEVAVVAVEIARRVRLGAEGAGRQVGDGARPHQLVEDDGLRHVVAEAREHRFCESDHLAGNRRDRLPRRVVVAGQQPTHEDPLVAADVHQQPLGPAHGHEVDGSQVIELVHDRRVQQKRRVQAVMQAADVADREMHAIVEQLADEVERLSAMEAGGIRIEARDGGAGVRDVVEERFVGPAVAAPQPVRRIGGDALEQQALQVGEGVEIEVAAQEVLDVQQDLVGIVRHDEIEPQALRHLRRRAQRGQPRRDAERPHPVIKRIPDRHQLRRRLPRHQRRCRGERTDGLRSLRFGFALLGHSNSLL